MIKVQDETSEYGQAPKSGWAKMVCELLVEDIDESKKFWHVLLGFQIAYQRPHEKFLYLEHASGAQIMLHQRCDVWETGEMQAPFGRGVMFQIDIGPVADVLKALQEAGWPLYEGPRVVWRRAGDKEVGQKEVFVQDPDGYLLMLFEELGVRPLSR